MKKIIRSLIAVIFLSVMTYLYMRWEATWLEVNVYSVDLGQANGSRIRVMNISDLHSSKFVSLDYISQAIVRGLAEKPDLIVMTGDYFTHGLTKDFPNTAYFQNYQKVLKQLSDFAPTFACLGNHDGGVWAHFKVNLTQELLEASGIKVLYNQSTTITIRNTKLTIIGLGDVWARELRPKEAFENISANDDSVKIAIVHNPDAKEEIRTYPWDILMAGHTHGGQLKLPLIGTPFAPVKDKRYVEGLKSWEGRWVQVTKGIGNLLGVRFNCRPEVSLIDII